MRAVYIPLKEKEIERLAELARREMRDPRSQGAWLIREGLRRAGLLPEGAGAKEEADYERLSAV